MSTEFQTPRQVSPKESVDQLADLAAYHEDGLVIRRGLFDVQRIAAVLQEADNLLENNPQSVDPRNLRCRFQTHAETGEKLFETFDPVIDISPGCRSLAADSGLLDLLGRLYGESACLFKDKLIFKSPGTRGYDLHQDYIAWDGFPETFLTVLIPLERADRSNGCTICYRGYHQQGLLTPADGNFHRLDSADFSDDRRVALELEPGDVAVFGGFTPHFSESNRSSQWRRQLYLSFNAASDGGDRRVAHYAQFREWMRQRYAADGVTDVGFW